MESNDVTIDNCVCDFAELARSKRINFSLDCQNIAALCILHVSYRSSATLIPLIQSFRQSKVTVNQSMNKCYLFRLCWYFLLEKIKKGKIEIINNCQYLINDVLFSFLRVERGGRTRLRFSEKAKR